MAEITPKVLGQIIATLAPLDQGVVILRVRKGEVTEVSGHQLNPETGAYMEGSPVSREG